ncbi:hypothetical protein [Paludisphaera mucosa]|uniref:Uncharacterized protein n=1 Tax=Paludisphaera mucosa TaxID=3030827 RepID=A0ABT6F4Y9_9BACT|nr:hypothetical protein [Paludisphaera mucosa]MDG3002582.1 hypothetical protein [Paludisphaera mucosa]
MGTTSILHPAETWIFASTALGEAARFVTANAWPLIAVWLIWTFKDELQSILKRVESGDLGGVKFKVREVVEEAEKATQEARDATDELRKLAVTISIPLATVISKQGNPRDHMNLILKMEFIHRLQHFLRSLNATEEQIAAAGGSVLAEAIYRHANAVFNVLAAVNAAKSEMILKSRDDRGGVWDRARFERFITENTLETGDEVDAALLDLEHVMANGTLRRPEKWQF